MTPSANELLEESTNRPWKVLLLQNRKLPANITTTNHADVQAVIVEGFNERDSKGIINAEFVVRAANSFGPMVAAWREVLDSCCSGKPDVVRIHDIQLKARRMLAIADGEMEQ